MELELELITVNAQGVVKETTYLGRKYLVVPVRMIVPGVLNGSKGKLNYSAEQIASNPSDWNGIPIVAPKHPVNKLGKPVSARSPKILERYGIGSVYNSEAKYALDAEGWFDIERTLAVDGRIVQWIRNNKKIELSTGLSLKVKKAPSGAVDNKGRAYDFDTYDYKPDHLAVLTDTVGACSIADGCGVLVNSHQNSMIELVHNEDNNMPAKRTIWHQMGVALGFLKDEDIHVSNQLSFGDIRANLSAQLNDMFPAKMGANGNYTQAPCYIIDVYKDSVIYSDGTDYYRLGYTVKGDTVTLSTDKPEEVQRVTSYKPIANESNEPEPDLWVGNSNAIAEELVLNPYPNEHACRAMDPGQMMKDSFRRKEVTPGVSLVMGKKTAGGSMEVQSYRFSSDKFTSQEAKDWLKKHNISCMEFAAASGKTNNVANDELLDHNWLINVANAITKKEGSQTLSASDYAYVPDPEKPSTWKLRIDDAAHVGGAIAAIGKGFRGQKVSIPPKDLPSVKAKIRAAWLKFHKDKTSSDLPQEIRNEAMPLTDEVRNENRTILVNSCTCNHNVPWKGWDVATINALNDDLLLAYGQWAKSLTPQPVQNNSPAVVPSDWKNKFINADGSHRVFDPVSQEWVNMPLPHQIPVAQPVNNGQTGNGSQQAPNPPAQVNNGGNNSKETPEQYLARTLKDAPPAVAAMWGQLQQNYVQEREQLMNTITANAEGEAKEALKKLYEGMDNNNLRLVVNALPQQQKQDTQPVTNFSLALPSFQQPISEKPLGLPVYDFSKK